MKKDKLKSVVLKFSIVFFIVIALLTYFSKTINNMLLPKVKVVSVQTDFPYYRTRLVPAPPSGRMKHRRHTIKIPRYRSLETSLE